MSVLFWKTDFKVLTFPFSVFIVSGLKGFSLYAFRFTLYAGFKVFSVSVS